MTPSAGGWPSSASATSACRPPSCSRRAASTSSASTSIRAPSRPSTKGELPFVEPDLAVGGQRRGQHGTTQGDQRDTRGRRLHHRRAHPVQRGPHRRPLLHSGCRRADRAPTARWRGRHPRVDVAARYHPADQQVARASCGPTCTSRTRPPGKPDVFVAHCPERVLPGRIMIEMVTNDRVVGGITRGCAEKAASIYRVFCQGEILLTDASSAEMAKLVENAYRDVNIAFANELSLICESLKLDVWEVIEMANRHPRVNILNPGPGVGGHCIAVDPVVHRRRRARAVQAHPHGPRGQRRQARSTSRSRSSRRRSGSASPPSPASAWPSSRTSTTCASRPAVDIVKQICAALPDTRDPRLRTLRLRAPGRAGDDREPPARTRSARRSTPPTSSSYSSTTTSSRRSRRAGSQARSLRHEGYVALSGSGADYLMNSP